MRNRKIIIILFVVLLSGCASKEIIELGSTEKEINKIQREQEKERENTSKYKHIPKYEKDEIEYEVYSYEKPDGKVGYQIFTEDADSRKSIGTGVDANSKTWEKVKIEQIITATKTDEIIK